MGNKVDPLSQNNDPTSLQQMSNKEVDTKQDIQPVVQIIPDDKPDYGDQPKAKDWMDNRSDPKNFNFCGKHWDEAKQNCDIERHCPDMKCEDPELNCFVGLGLSADHCNAFDMLTGNTRAPTDKPTTLAPTLVSLEEQNLEQTSDGDGNDWRDNQADPRNFQFCGTDWGDAKNNCNMDRHCPDMKCEDPGLSCFIHLGYAGASSCNAHDLYRAPTYMPTTLAPTQVSWFLILLLVSVMWCINPFFAFCVNSLCSLHLFSQQHQYVHSSCIVSADYYLWLFAGPSNIKSFRAFHSFHRSTRLYLPPKS